jgi:hypothetical protein
MNSNFDFKIFYKILIYMAAVMPALYILVVIQYSAITFPFWDHTELIKWIALWHDGSFEFKSLLEPHNHTRPFVYRFVMVLNAVLTGWDIRSEYIYIYIALFGTFGCHFWALRTLYRNEFDNRTFPIALLLLSIILFSPAGHNNHWWSMMFQLDAANLFISIGMLMPFIYPNRWGFHLVGIIGCWLATFTLTNGFFAVASVVLVIQLSSPNFLRPSRLTLFWICNLLGMLYFYFPGIAMSTGLARPGAGEILQFFLAYLGAPFADLIWFPFKTNFDLPISITFNVVTGAFLLAISFFMCCKAWPEFKRRNSSALILFGFLFFSTISALLTAWGRANFDEFGVSNANGSRYTIFGSYLLLGILYYVATGISLEGFRQKRWIRYIAAISVICFVTLSSLTYFRALKVYDDAKIFNHTLSRAYDWGLESKDEDRFIHPNAWFVKQLKSDLQRLEIGPYKDRPYKHQVGLIGEFKQSGIFCKDCQFIQSFIASNAGLKAISVKFIPEQWSKVGGQIEWRLMEVEGGQLVATGLINKSDINSEGWARLKLPYIKNSMAHEYTLVLNARTESPDLPKIALYSKVNGESKFKMNHSLNISKDDDLIYSIIVDYTE